MPRARPQRPVEETQARQIDNTHYIGNGIGNMASLGRFRLNRKLKSEGWMVAAPFTGAPAGVKPAPTIILQPVPSTVIAKSSSKRYPFCGNLPYPGNSRVKPEHGTICKYASLTPVMVTLKQNRL